MTGSRRGLLKKTLGGAVLLAAAGAVPLALRRTRPRAAAAPLQFFTPAEYSIFAAVADRVLTDAEPRVGVAERADAFLAPLPPADARDFRRLLALFDNALYGFLRGGPPRPFTQMSPDDQDDQLARWQTSRFPIERTGYQAMKRLAAAMYFSDPRTYAGVGYPGPPYELIKSVTTK
ncbi:MAG TPA: gluconate 2-dehydrogenase subunit 3 family protein [Myxococcales bacterium]|nr:gluconate 2-dehydrogenase subunit 3 family protein [Myxococcales bacterium]